MDQSAEEFVETETGCNFCDQAEKNFNYYGTCSDFYIEPGEKYDCLIGLSGGVDSCTVLHHAVKLGYKPLCFSVDNGWNDPKADMNIMKMVEKLKVPFIRYNIDLPKFKELQSAFIRQGQKNIEIPTDHILMAVSYQLADEYGITNILSGGNVATESIMPASWGYNARDLVHLKDVYKTDTGKKLTGLPTCSLLKWNYYRWIKKIKIVYLLDYLNYHREDSIKLLEKEYDYEPYGEKHCESTWTWWFQNYYLYEKFGIDKRKAHLSSLIVSGQMTRSEAMTELEKNPVYPELGIEQKVLKYPKKPYTDFKRDRYDTIAKIIKCFF